MISMARSPSTITSPASSPARRPSWPSPSATRLPWQSRTPGCGFRQNRWLSPPNAADWRDLHDAVTQTLFSTSLIADVLPRLWERDQNEGLRRLNELRQLTRGALAEMRALLLELRPATLSEVGVGELLRQLTEAITGRARVPITLTVDGQPQLQPDVQIALYRIAQEALNNVARHANASQAAVYLHGRVDEIELRISDDGQGFDPSCIALEHLGLGIMRERAEAIGATLHIEAQPGSGTQVVIYWSQRNAADGGQHARQKQLLSSSF